MATFEGRSVTHIQEIGSSLAVLLDKSDVVFFMEEKDLFSRCESRPDYFSGPLFKDSLRSYQIVSQFDSDRSQGVLGSEVVVEESFVPDKTRLSSQERG